MEEELINHFCAVTSADVKTAERYLAFAANDLDTAVTMFFETGGHLSENPSTSLAEPDILSSRSILPEANDVDDEAMARRLAEEWGGQGGQQEVRAPIAPTRQVLQDDIAEFDPFSVPAQFMQRFGNGALDQSSGNGPRARGIFNQAAPSVWDQTDEEQLLLQTTGGASAQSSKSSRLAKLFQPPFDIMSIIDLDTAKSEARSAHKWIMVNLQDNTDFASQVLNRDLWKDTTVKAVVSESFCFLQYVKDSADGQQYSQFYPVDKYPHISILDPRTGERVKIWSEPITAMEFISEVTEFLERYSLDEDKQNPVHKRKRAEPKKLEQMSEEDQLNAAIMASVTGKTPLSGLPNDEDRSYEDVKPDDVRKDPIVLEPSAFDAIPSVLTDEPPAGPETTRIQLRLPASRTVRRFNLSDPVQRIFEYVKAGLKESSGRTFKIIFNRVNLFDCLTSTIEQAGLKNASLVVEFYED